MSQPETGDNPSSSQANVPPLSSRPDDRCVVNKIEDVLLLFVVDAAAHPSPMLHLPSLADGSRARWSRHNAGRMARLLYLLAKVHSLVLNNQFVTKRDLYYQNVQLFNKQSSLDASLSAACRLLGEKRINLHIVCHSKPFGNSEMATSKGIVFGPLAFWDASDGNELDCAVAPLPITAHQIAQARDLRSQNAKFVLVVEKDAIMQLLVDGGWTTVWPNGILMTGKGYPDLATRQLLKLITKHFNIPVYVLVDADPHERSGNVTFTKFQKPSNDTLHLEVPTCHLLGVLRSEVDELPLTKEQYIQLKHSEFRKIQRLRKRIDVRQDSQLMKQLWSLETSGTKLEIEALSALSPNYLCETYLRKKLPLDSQS